MLILEETSTFDASGVVGALLLIGAFALAIWASIWVIRGFSSSTPSEDLIEAAIAIGGLWLAAQALNKGLTFLKDLNLSAVGENLKRAIEEASREIESTASGIARLDKAQELLTTGNEIERDAAAMLASATMELGLRTLARRHHLALSSEEESLVGLAIRLAREGVISQSEREAIKHYAMSIRNRVMHGEVGRLQTQEVSSLIEFGRGFFSAHRLA